MAGLFGIDLEQIKKDGKVWLKRFWDKLEQIEKNTAPKVAPLLGSPSGFTVPASPTLNNFEVEISQKYIFFFGMTTNQQDQLDWPGSDINHHTSPIAIKIGSKSSPAFNLFPGMLIELPIIPTKIFLTSVTYTLGNGKWQFFTSDTPISFGQSFIPFRRNKTQTITTSIENQILRASLDDNGDQYIIFRSTPSVSISGTPNVIVTQVGAGTGGGYTPFLDAALSTTVITIKSSAGKLGGWYLFNPAAAVTYMQIFDSASVTLGTTVPKLSFGIPAGSAANLEDIGGINFVNSIKVAATTTPTGSTAPATALVANFMYS